MKLQFLLLWLFGSAATLIPATDPRIRVVGRTVTDGTALTFDWSSVYIEVQATGPLSLLAAEGWGHGNEYHISINGSSAFQQLNTSKATQSYKILTTGQSGLVRIEKVTEARTDVGGVVRFIGLDTEVLGPKPAAPSRRIECIGDSIMCGCHAERWAPFQTDCPSTRGTPEARESSRLSWCPTVARAVNADYHMECESGNGLIATDGSVESACSDVHVYRVHMQAIPAKLSTATKSACQRSGSIPWTAIQWATLHRKVEGVLVAGILLLLNLLNLMLC